MTLFVDLMRENLLKKMFSKKKVGTNRSFCIIICFTLQERANFCHLE